MIPFASGPRLDLVREFRMDPFTVRRILDREGWTLVGHYSHEIVYTDTRELPPGYRRMLRLRPAPVFWHLQLWFCSPSGHRVQVAPERELLARDEADLASLLASMGPQSYAHILTELEAMEAQPPEAA